MEFQHLFESVAAHVRSQKIKCGWKPGKPVSAKTLIGVESKLNITLPETFKAFYLSIGDGCEFHWTVPGRGRKPFANLQIPNLKYLASMYTGWRSLALYTPQAAREYGFPHTKNPALALQTAARMWHWLPVLEEGNGDMMCIDLSTPAGRVVYCQHDWLDGGSGDNGHPMAPDWAAFLLRWGSVCFQFPRSLYWPQTYIPGGIDWTGPEFQAPFILPASA